MFTTINPIYSPESIAFQKDEFFKALCDIVDDARSTGQEGKTDTEMAIADAIKHYTWINVDVNIGDYQMSTGIPHIDRNSPLLEGAGFMDPALSKTSLSDIRKSARKAVTGMVDLASARVGGYFAELPPTPMYLNASMLYGNPGKLYKIFDGRQYTSREIASIILHETGHVFTFFEFLVRFRTTNQILSATLRELEGSSDVEKREIIIQEASQALDLSDLDAKELKHKKNTTVYTVLVSSMARKNRSQSGGEGYDINSFEALSDQFAVRHGAGRDLVTALDKLHKGSIHCRGWTSYFFMEFAKLGLFMVGVGAVATGNAALAYGLITLTTSLLLVDSHHDWYDKAGARNKRVRNQLVELLKNPNVGREDSARIREDIDAIDDVNEKYKDHTQFLGLVFDYLIPSGIAKRKDIEFQQRLEELSSNKLFYYANKIQHS